MRYGWLLPLLFLCACSREATDYVDPRISSEGLGRVFIGPSVPFGMVRPSPDCTPSPNSGWLPLPERVDGFAQIHVSGTGGGPKYGNVLIMPLTDPEDRYGQREEEEIALGYYATRFGNSGVGVEVTASDRVSLYRIRYPGAGGYLLTDLDFFLGRSETPGAREAQEFVDAGLEVLDNQNISGYQTLRGGWNNGGPYTVYFHLRTSAPFTVEEAEDHRSLVRFGEAEAVEVRIGLSFRDRDLARENLEALEGVDFEGVRARCVNRWEDLLSRVKVRGSVREKRMFYTALYHTMLMPSDRTGEWAPAGDEIYYDDFYALWDTYRTSLPLITLLDPDRMRDIANALLTIYRHDGFLPDARSGNANGRTQGGSNAEIVFADAFVKGVEGVDYALALEAMRKDAEVPPADDEAEGRGALAEYRRLGYIPWGIPRAGNRTVEYAACDAAIATLASGLGQDSLAADYAARSGNWRNLWREDVTDDGVSGFIMPRDAEGNWLDSLPFGHSARFTPRYAYTPTMAEGPWYTKWWSAFFYEGSSWEYSLSVPHDVPSLVEQCGGAEAFEARLDRFFAGGYYNVANEPSFLTPCLYHWIGKPEKTSRQVLQILADHFDDTPGGLPGNDDSGAMSSWQAFHQLGLYPVAGTDQYVVHTPVFRRSEIRLSNGKRFIIKTKGPSGGTIREARLNGKRLDSLFLRHADILKGGMLVLVLERDSFAGLRPPQSDNKTKDDGGLPFRITFRLHGQTRRFDVGLLPRGDSLCLEWGIERNLRGWTGSYTMTPEALRNGSRLSFRMPEDGLHVTLDPGETFAVMPAERLLELRDRGRVRFNQTEYRLLDSLETAFSRTLLHAVDVHEGAEIWVWNHPSLPLIWRMQNNPAEVDWAFSSLDPVYLETLSVPGRTGGGYYAYPQPDAAETPPPSGYEPVYVSHYGRHGSRYLTSDSRYRRVLDFFSAEHRKGNLTPFGEDFLSRMEQLWTEVEGRGGTLSETGVRQHREIAERLQRRCPSLFAEGARVDASSSLVGRCRASMDSFCDALEEAEPSLAVTRRCDSSTMAVLVPKGLAIDSLDSETSPWRLSVYAGVKARFIHPARALGALLKDPSRTADPLALWTDLYYLVEGMQDIPSGVDFSDLLTAEERFGAWQCVATRMYYVNTRCPESGGIGPSSVRVLLQDVLDKADASLSGASPDVATLRFGHDSVLIRLLSLMGVEGCTAEERSLENYWRVWQDWRVSPMAANLQLVFYRNRKGATLVKLFLNEREVSLPALGPGPYYDWSRCRAYWQQLLNS